MDRREKAGMGTSEEFRRLIEFAIGEERKAQRTYKDLAGKAGDAYVKAVLEALHEQEVQHEEKLKGLLASLRPGPD
jgi:rubrerythrin